VSGGISWELSCQRKMVKKKFWRMFAPEHSGNMFERMHVQYATQDSKNKHEN
jgi:hypothetical protein